MWPHTYKYILRIFQLSSTLVLLSQKWDHLCGVQYTNIHTEQRYWLYCMFAQIWVLGDKSRKLEHHLVVSLLYSSKNNEITCCILTSSLSCTLILELYSSLTYACSQAGGVQSSWFWIELVVAIFPCHLYLFPSYPRSLLTSCFFGIHPAFGAFWAGCSPFISLLAPLQGHNC